MLSAGEACGLGLSRLERGIIGMEYRFFKKVRSRSSALDGRAFWSACSLSARSASR